MGREQKYKIRTRHLYALIFADRYCYIGQTSDLKRRYQQHKRAWLMGFEFMPLASIEGTQADGEEHEYSWRYKAMKAGYGVYGKNRAGETFVIDPRRRMNIHRRMLASRMKWPGPAHLKNYNWLWWLAAMTFLFLLFACRS
jgi:hypothetical protein